MFKSRNTGRLRIGRLSVPGGVYFVTCCTSQRRPFFTDTAARQLARAEIARLTSDGNAPWIAGTVMPDHVHLLFELGPQLSLGRTLAKLKGNISRTIHLSEVTFDWQENAFEHHCRPDEAIESYAFYIFMNPYRARLCTLNERWDGWVCTKPSRFRFLSYISPEGPIAQEWLRDVERIAPNLHTGE